MGGIDIKKLGAFYDKHAATYDATRKLILGKRDLAIEKLDLKKGDTVIDLACGTGFNFPHLFAVVGKEGKIIGVDYSEGMLSHAEEKIKEAGWTNIELIQGDAQTLQFEEKADGLICAYAVCAFPDWRAILRNAATWLKPGKKFSVIDVTYPMGLLAIFKPLVYLFGKITYVDYSRQAWEEFEKVLEDVHMVRLDWKTKYLCWGTKR